MLGVLLFHSAETTGGLGIGISGRFAEVAVNGVLVFFGISGFLLYRPFVAARATGRHGAGVARYARRRVLRIVPAYWVILTLLAIFPGIVGVFSGDWWRYYFFLQVYSARTVGGGIPLAWTLCVEVSFYILLPLWAWTIGRLPARPGTRRWLVTELAPLAAVALAGLAVQLAALRQQVPYVLGISLAGQITWLAIGMALAVLSVASQEDPGAFRWIAGLADRAALCWAGAALAVLALAVLVPRGGLFGLIAATQTVQPFARSLLRLVLEGALVVLLILPAVFGDGRRDAPRRLLAWGPLVWLGVVSYSFYLLHLTLVEFTTRSHLPTAFSATGLNLLEHVHTAPTLVAFAVALAGTLALASLSYRLIELPFLRRKERPASYPPAR